MNNLTNKCSLCPRSCGANREHGAGLCGAAKSIRVARAALHMWEEPCISGTNGSGTVFFTGCALKCCYCQNYQISAHSVGKDISARALADIFVRLEGEGAHNISLVTAAAYTPQIINALEIAKVNIPVVYNTSSYEAPQTLKMLKPYIDIWLADLKYVACDISARYSLAPDYFAVASSAILQMASYAPSYCLDERGIMQKGLIVRHLALPNNLPDTKSALKWAASSLPKNSWLLSLMSQYTPCYNAFQFKELSRRLSSYEYKKATSYAHELGLENGYFQERQSAQKGYTPLFDLQGV